MARITVEDCLENVDNRFQLVLTAAKRARQLANGKPPTLEWEKDKVTVMALREIAQGNITSAILDEVEQVEEPQEDIFGIEEITTSSDSSQVMSSEELLASQVEALLAASNDDVVSNTEAKVEVEPTSSSENPFLAIRENSLSEENKTPMLDDSDTTNSEQGDV